MTFSHYKNRSFKVAEKPSSAEEIEKGRKRMIELHEAEQREAKEADERKKAKRQRKSA